MTASEKPWTPEMPLRSDATGEQINERHDFLYEQGGKRVGYEFNEMDIVSDEVEHQVARELASAVSLEKDREINELRAGFMDGETRDEKCCADYKAELRAEIVSLKRSQTADAIEKSRLLRIIDEKDAEIARLRKDAERLDWLNEADSEGLNLDKIAYWNGAWCHIDPAENELLSAHDDNIRAAIDSAKEAQ